jgi:hypothetical protein
VDLKIALIEMRTFISRHLPVTPKLTQEDGPVSASQIKDNKGTSHKRRIKVFESNGRSEATMCESVVNS